MSPPRRPRRAPSLPTLALLALVGACGAAPEPTSPAADVPVAALPAPDPARLGLTPGESMEFEVSLAGVLAGEASLSVGAPGEVDGRPALVVASRVATAGVARWLMEVRDDLTSTIDLATGLPVSAFADVAYGERQFRGATRYDGAKVTIEWQARDGASRTMRYDLGAATPHDAHSAMAAVRTWEGTPGEAYRLFVLGGRRLWRTDVTWRGPEPIDAALGAQRAVRIDGVAQRVDRKLAPEPGKPPRRFSVWLSDDADRAPLRVTATTELGDVTIELVRFDRP